MAEPLTYRLSRPYGKEALLSEVCGWAEEYEEERDCLATLLLVLVRVLVLLGLFGEEGPACALYCRFNDALLVRASGEGANGAEGC